jgi:hypothetical protein
VEARTNKKQKKKKKKEKKEKKKKQEGANEREMVLARALVWCFGGGRSDRLTKQQQDKNGPRGERGRPVKKSSSHPPTVLDPAGYPLADSSTKNSARRDRFFFCRFP